MHRHTVQFPRWGATPIAAYLCAMKADRDALHRNPHTGPPGLAPGVLSSF